MPEASREGSPRPTPRVTHSRSLLEQVRSIAGEKTRNNPILIGEPKPEESAARQSLVHESSPVGGDKPSSRKFKINGGGESDVPPPMQGGSEDDERVVKEPLKGEPVYLEDYLDWDPDAPVSHGDELPVQASTPGMKTPPLMGEGGADTAASSQSSVTADQAVGEPAKADTLVENAKTEGEVRRGGKARKIREFDQEHPDYEDWEESVDKGDEEEAVRIENEVRARIKLDKLLEPTTSEEEALEMVVQGAEGSANDEIDVATFAQRDKVALLLERVESSEAADIKDKYLNIIQGIEPDTDLTQSSDGRELQVKAVELVASELGSTLYSPRQVELIISRLGLDPVTEKAIREAVYKGWEAQIVEQYKDVTEEGYEDKKLLSRLIEDDGGFKKWKEEELRREAEQKDQSPSESRPEQTPAQRGMQELVALLKEVRGGGAEASIEDLRDALLKIPALSETTRRKLAENPRNVITYLSLQMIGGKLDIENGEFWASIDPRIRMVLMGEQSQLRKSKPDLVMQAESSFHRYVFETDFAPQTETEQEHDEAILKANLTLGGSRYSVRELRRGFENWIYSTHRSEMVGVMKLEELPLSQGTSDVEELMEVNIQNLRYRPEQIEYLLEDSGLDTAAIDRVRNNLYANVQYIENQESYRSYVGFLKESEGYKEWKAKEVSTQSEKHEDPKVPLAQPASSSSPVIGTVSQTDEGRSSGENRLKRWGRKIMKSIIREDPLVFPLPSSKAVNDTGDENLEDNTALRKEALASGSEGRVDAVEKILQGIVDSGDLDVGEAKVLIDQAINIVPGGSRVDMQTLIDSRKGFGTFLINSLYDADEAGNGERVIKLLEAGNTLEFDSQVPTIKEHLDYFKKKYGGRGRI